MEWIRFEDVARAYGSRDIFAGLAGELRDDAKVGLVGPNGAGKSSLLRILAGDERSDEGTIVRARGAKLGYLSQTVNVANEAPLRSVVERAFERVHAEERALRDAEVALSTVSDDPDVMQKALDRYAAALESFERHGGMSIEKKMRAMLSAFGFEGDDLDRPSSAFSGGQRTRASLARMMLEEPDYLVLDEPTNHLDLETVRWLEDFLIDDARATIVVSHDRYFLDRIATQIWELDGGRLERYVVKRGRAYADYLEQKAEREAQARAEYDRFREEERRRKNVIAELRTHGSHNYSHVKSREKQLAKLDRVEAPRTAQTHINVKLEASRRATGGLAVAVEGLAAGYAEPLFADLSFELARGERLAVVGPNGSGKSTLLRVLAGKRSAQAGGVRIMEGVRTAFFSQDAAEELPAGASATDAVLDGSTVTPEEARALLGRLGLGGDAGDKPVEAFSGGERRRIMLARLMARAADCLFLDEPTNDLDIPSREALEAVLAGYGGALVVVSHDRYLLARLAEKVLWLKDGAAATIEGGYERFEELARTGASPETLATAAQARRGGSKPGTAGKNGAAPKNGTAEKIGTVPKHGGPAPKNGTASGDRVAVGGGAPTASTGDAATAPVAATSNGAPHANGTNGAVPVADDGRAPGSRATPADREERIRRDREQRALAACERDVAKADAHVARLELEFGDPAIYDDRARVGELEAELEAARAAVEAAYARWEALTETAPV